MSKIKSLLVLMLLQKSLCFASSESDSESDQKSFTNSHKKLYKLAFTGGLQEDSIKSYDMISHDHLSVDNNVCRTYVIDCRMGKEQRSYINVKEKSEHIVARKKSDNNLYFLPVNQKTTGDNDFLAKIIVQPMPSSTTFGIEVVVEYFKLKRENASFAKLNGSALAEFEPKN